MNVLDLNPFLLFVLIAICSVLIRLVLLRSGLIYVVKKLWRSFEDWFQVYQIFNVPEFNNNMQENQLYRKISAYLNSLTSIEDSDFTNLVTGKKPNEIVLCLDPNQTVDDDFLGARVSWTNQPDSGNSPNTCRAFALKIRKADKRRILRPYLQYIHQVADELEERKKDLKLFMNIDHGNDDSKGKWRSVPFTHPATFETIAMESDLKNKVKSDIESFLKAKQYYHRLGRVWKRSFLLYGPSGTGKSSFVAAMANFLGYNVYDMDVSKVLDDSEMKLLLLQTSNKSVIVIEDLDRCFMEESGGVSLSGILNFMDGILNSCCAEERVMVFTMNSKDHIDPSFLRPGRIDVHIHFPLCDFSAFRSLANNYLGLKDHKLFQQVEEMFQTGATLSPAEISELMIANRSSPSRALKSVITALQTDGDGRAAGKMRPRLGDNNQVETGEPAGAFCRESLGTVKEFKKLYGLLRLKSGRKVEPVDTTSGKQEG